MVFNHDLPLFLPESCVNERQWDLRNADEPGKYNRPQMLKKDCTFDVTDLGILVKWSSGQRGLVPYSSISNVLITD